MPTAGELTQRLTFQAEGSPSYDTRGQVSSLPRDVATVWAKVKPLTGNEAILARQQEAAATHEVTIRYSSDVAAIAPSYWALWGDIRLDISSAVNLEQRNEWLVLLCAQSIPATT
jgi:SPP1 family predicted phage head-tail adaptor